MSGRSRTSKSRPPVTTVGRIVVDESESVVVIHPLVLKDPESVARYDLTLLLYVFATQCKAARKSLCAVRLDRGTGT